MHACATEIVPDGSAVILPMQAYARYCGGTRLSVLGVCKTDALRQEC